MKELICIVCPRGCHLKVEEGEELSVRGKRLPPRCGVRKK